MARKGCGPYNLGAPKTIAKQVTGPLTEEEASRRPQITGPIVREAEDYVARKDAEQKATPKPRLQSQTDQDGRTYNVMSYKNKTYNLPTRDEQKKLQERDARGEFDNYQDYDDYNKKHEYDYKSNTLNVVDTKTNKKKVKKIFSRGQASLNQSGGGARTQEDARALNNRGQLDIRTRAESFMKGDKSGATFADYNTAQGVKARHKRDSIASAQQAQDYVARMKFLANPNSPNNKVKSAAYKMKGYGSKSYK